MEPGPGTASAPLVWVRPGPPLFSHSSTPSAVLAAKFIRDAAGGLDASPAGMTLACLAAIGVCGLVGAFTGAARQITLAAGPAASLECDGTWQRRDRMYLVWLGTALVVLKWLEVEPVGSLSWWWVLAPLAVAFAWFEGLEKLFGRDRRQVEMADFEKQARERLRAAAAPYEQAP